MVLASEAGVLPIPEELIERKGRLQPGQAVPRRPRAGRIVDDAEIKHEVSTQQPYGEWYGEQAVHFDDLPDASRG